MKKLMIIAIAIIGMIISENIVIAGTQSPYCPSGPVNRRLDRENSVLISQTGSWVEMNRRFDEDQNPDWGNSACIDPGTACHYGDWFTWWTGIVAPPVNPNCTPEIIEYVPAGYNPNTGEYTPDLGGN